MPKPLDNDALQSLSPELIHRTYEQISTYGNASNNREILLNAVKSIRLRNFALTLGPETFRSPSGPLKHLE